MESSLEQVIKEILEWQKTQFPQATQKSRATHLLREAAELYVRPDDIFEVIDVIFLALGIVDAQVIPLDVLLRNKLAVNKAREWGKVDESGVSEHVRDCQGNNISIGHSVVEVDDNGSPTGKTGRLKDIHTGEVEWDSEDPINYVDPEGKRHQQTEWSGMKDAEIRMRLWRELPGW